MLNPFSDMAGFTMNPMSALPQVDLANPFAPPKEAKEVMGMFGMGDTPQASGVQGSPANMAGWNDFMNTVKKPMDAAPSAVESVSPIGGGSSIKPEVKGIK